MSELDDLLAACVANPDDDAPRLVWADAVGGERGELVVIQCKLASDASLPPAERGVLIKRLDELLDAHGAEWSGFAKSKGRVERCAFRRGFVEAVEADITKLTLGELFKRAPLLQSLHVSGIARSIHYHEPDHKDDTDAIAELTKLFGQAEMQRLRGIEIDDAVIYELTGDTEWDFDSTSLADNVLELVARTGALRGMRALAIRDTFTARGMHELLGANVLASVESLAFEFGEADRSQVAEMFAQMPNLRALDLHSALKPAAIADLIPPTVVELRVQASDVRGDLAALMQSPCATSIERLDLLGGDLHERPHFFAAFPKLRSLDIRYGGYGSLVQGKSERREAAIAHFTKTAMPALRELRLFSDCTDAEALAIAEALGPQLELLDLLGHDHVKSIGELRTKVAGHVRAGGYRKPQMLLQIGTNTREPWLLYGHVAIKDVKSSSDTDDGNQ